MPTAPCFRAALFDMDGLLIDSERVILDAWLAASRAHGIAVRFEDYAAVIGRAGPETRALLIGMAGGEEAFRSVRTHAARLMAPDGGKPHFPLKAGVVEVLEALRVAGVPCGVASSSASAEIRRRLGNVGVLHYFDAVTGGDEVARGKPDPAVYLLAAERIGADPGHCLAFEDSDHGAHAALAAGAQVVMVPDLKRPSAELAARSFAVIASLTDAGPHLHGWFGTR